jgi:hypothetical protein
VLPGDIVYVEHDSGRFAVLYCTKLNKSGSKASPVLERVAWVGARAPSPSEVDGLPLRGGPTGARSSILVTDMKLGVRIVLLRRGAPEPDASHLRQPKTAAPYRTNMRSLLGESVLLQGS